MLPALSKVEPKDLCFDLNILSSGRDHLNLEIWLINIKNNVDCYIGLFI